MTHFLDWIIRDLTNNMNTITLPLLRERARQLLNIHHQHQGSQCLGSGEGKHRRIIYGRARFFGFFSKINPIENNGNSMGIKGNYYQLSIIHNSLFIIYHSLPLIHYWSCIIHYLLYHVSFVIYCIMYHSSFIINYWSCISSFHSSFHIHHLSSMLYSNHYHSLLSY